MFVRKNKDAAFMLLVHSNLLLSSFVRHCLSSSIIWLTSMTYCHQVNRHRPAYFVTRLSQIPSDNFFPNFPGTSYQGPTICQFSYCLNCLSLTVCYFYAKNSRLGGFQYCPITILDFAHKSRYQYLTCSQFE